MERLAYADRSENLIFASVHRLPFALILVIEARTMQQAVNAIQKQFSLNGMAMFQGTPRRLVRGHHDVSFNWPGGIRPEVERQDVSRLGDTGMPLVQMYHPRIIDDEHMQPVSPGLISASHVIRC